MDPLFIQNGWGKKGPKLGSGSSAVSFAASTLAKQQILSESVVNVVCHCARLTGVTVLLGGLIHALMSIYHHKMSILDATKYHTQFHPAGSLEEIQQDTTARTAP